MKNRTVKKWIAAGVGAVLLLATATAIRLLPGMPQPLEVSAAAPEVREPSEETITVTESQPQETESAPTAEAAEILPQQEEAPESTEQEAKTQPAEPAPTVPPAPPKPSTPAPTEPPVPESTEPSKPAAPSVPTEPSKSTESTVPEETVPEKDTQKPDADPAVPEETPETGDVDWTEIPSHLQQNVLNPQLTFTIAMTEHTVEAGQTWDIPFCYPGHPKEITWTSLNPDVATVDQWGTVTAKAEGTATIQGTDKTQTLSCRITVLPATEEVTDAEKAAAAYEVAYRIAYVIMNDPSITTDIERIAYAARFVHEYVKAGHTSSLHPDYNTAYGTLVAGYSNCAGSTRAMGLVLECMGFKWKHVNENQYTHQWCKVYDVDGKTAFADGSSYGIVGFGSRDDESNWLYMTNQGELVYYREYFG